METKTWTRTEIEAMINGNDLAVEFETALSQVCRIFRFRIEDRVSP